MKCGNCTSCCTLFYIDSNKIKNDDIFPVKVESGQSCQYQDHFGCTRHEDRPQICRNFFCAYAESDDLPISLRPDKCGIIFEKLSNNLFLGTVDHRIEVTKIAFAQIENFNVQGFSVVLKKNNTREVIVKTADVHNKDDIINEYKTLRELANG